MLPGPEYETERTLDEADLAAEPQRQFQRWLADAEAAGEPQPRAMALATASPDGLPAVRMVLLQQVDERGFTFETNLDSPKAADLRANPRAGLVFYWPRLGRQVRVSGAVAPLDRADVAASYAAQPTDVRAMLRFAQQSHVVADRAALERAYALSLASADGQRPTLPDHWGGYRLTVETIEFWQARAHWLQDRLRYARAAGGWRIERLVP